jgi:hypothetical protein
VSKNIYERTYTEQVECNYQNVPLLKQSPFNKIYETRAQFLEQDSVYRIDKMVDLFTKANCSITHGFNFFRSDIVTNNAGVKKQLEFNYYFKEKDKYYFEVKFGRLSNKIAIFYDKCEESSELYISSFLNYGNTLAQLGLGHTVMSLIKSLAIRLEADIRLNCEVKESIEFYKKEQFELVYEYGDEYIWKWNKEKLEQDSKKAFKLPPPSVRNL